MAAATPLKIATGEIQNFATGDFISVANGGTGAITAATAVTNLGALGVANNLSDLGNTLTARNNLGATAGSYYTQLATAPVSPADATTYFFGSNMINTLRSTIGSSRIYMLRAGVINKVYVFVGSTSGSSEISTISLRLNNTTDFNISTALTTNASALFSTTSLGITVAVNDYIDAKWLTPTWVTNPTNMGLSIFFQVD